jgi:hypothetical protein
MSSPGVLVGSRLLAGSYAPITVPPVGGGTAVLSITTSFSSITRVTGDTASAVVTVTRTVRSDTSCSVPWSIQAVGSNPVTGAYFQVGVLPSGTITFNAGELTKTVTILLSAGNRPDVQMTGRFALGEPTNATLGTVTLFNFFLTAREADPGRVDGSEPEWAVLPLIASAPNKTTMDVVSELSALNSTEAGHTYVVAADLDADGATYTISGNGTLTTPVAIRGNSDAKSSFPTLKNCTLNITGTRVVIQQLRLENVTIRLVSGQYTQIQHCRFSGYSSGGIDNGAIVYPTGSTARYTLVFANSVLKASDALIMARCFIFSNAITVTNHWKYLWVRRNLFKNFQRPAADADAYVLRLGNGASDANKNVHAVIQENLFKDLDTDGYAGYAYAGNIRVYDNTFETTVKVGPGGGGGGGDGDAKWWVKTQRSGREWSSGPSYWSAGPDDDGNFDDYEREIAFIDIANGGRPDSSHLTMALCHGGSYATENNTIQSGSQLDWTATTGHWNRIWQKMRPGTWLVWAVNFYGEDRHTETEKGGDSSILQEIKDGDWDRSFGNFGRRILKNFADNNPRGHPIDRLLLRIEHENNQSNYYRIYEGTRLLYKQAYERALSKIRDGLGDQASKVKFMFAPGHTPKIGAYDSWCANNIDILSVSWHPTRSVNTREKVRQYIKGDDGGNDNSKYGLDEMLAFAQRANLPLCFPEWSPKNIDDDSNVISDICMEEAYDNMFNLADVKSRLVGECVYHRRMLDPEGYRQSDAEGKAAWRRAVNVLKTKWSGTKPS